MVSVAEGIAQNEASKELKRVKDINANFALYNEMPDVLPVTPPAPNDNIKLGLPRLIVDKGVSFLFGEDLGIQVEGAEADDPRQIMLDGTWRFNQKMTRLLLLGINGGVAGHAFIKIQEATERGDPFPRLVVLDPANWRAIHDEDDIGIVNAYEGKWTSMRSGKVVAKRQRVERQDNNTWTVVDEESSGDSPVWRLTKEPSIWNHPYAPILDCQNLPMPNAYYGLSDLETDVVDVARDVNLVLSRMNRIIRNHADPKYTLTGGSGKSEFKLAIPADGVIKLPAEMELKLLEMAGDLGATMDLYKELVTAFFELCRIPEVARGKMDTAGNLSGVALKILYEPIVEKTRDKRRLYGDMLIELNRRLMDLGGFGEANWVTLNWAEIVPADPSSDVKDALGKQALGVSKATLIKEMGYSAEDEAAKKALETEALGNAALDGFNVGV